MTRTRKQSASRVAYRYLAGRPLDGYPRSDSTFLQPATKAVGEIGRASRWHMLPGWQRAAWRVTPPAVALATTVGMVTHPLMTEVTLGSGTASGAVWVGFRTRRAVRHWRHKRTYTRPFTRTMARTLGVVPKDLDLEVPVDFQDEEGGLVRVQLPADTHINAETKVAVRQVVAQKLGLHDPIETYHTVGRDPFVTFRPAPRPPERVGWADVAEAFRKAPEVAPVLGLGPRSVVVDADLDADSPHIGISAGSGGGKSVLIRNILTHGLHHGSAAVVFDYKRSSHKWAEGLPGVVICKNIDDIHDWAVKLGAEAEHRNRAADDGGFNAHRIYVCVEEWNALAGKLQTYWDGIRDKGDPKRSPAVTAIADITFMGRHVKMNLLGVAQLLSARTTGGPEVRENFATRCLTRYTVNAWKMLAPEVWPMPKKSKITGRWQVVKSGEAIETQVAFLTDEQAQDWAMSGVANPIDVLGPSTPPTQGIRPGTVPASPRLVGLREAIDDGLLPGNVISLDALRKKRQRDRAFPPAVGRNGNEDLFSLAELVAWKLRVDAVRLVDDVEEVA